MCHFNTNSFLTYFPNIMKPIYAFSLLFTFLISMSSCDADKEHSKENIDIVYERANNSGLTVLAIGNSFTEDATRYIPQIIDAFEEDDVFFAKITKSGTSLKDHWNLLSSSAEEYSFCFSKNSYWASTSIKTLNEALELTNWDYIVLQQLSNTSGLYDSYQPYFNNLI